MTYYTISPRAKLAGYVRFFWVLEGGEANNPYVYRSMADSCTELLFHYRGRFEEIGDNDERISNFTSGIHSHTNKVRRFITDGQFGIFGAYLYPFAARRLFRLPPGELTNQTPDLNSVLGKEGKELEEQMMTASNNRMRCRILTQFLERMLGNTSEDQHPALHAVKYLIHSKKQHSVQELADHFNLSKRQFRRKFREYSGFNPKLFMRIIRFQEACNHYGNAKSLAEIAYEYGYYDQSHFIREFKEFSGYEPSTYFTGNAEGTEWRETSEFNPKNSY